ncbi:hypothetical protein Tco_0368471 [Tanacetum coccineum]
MESLDSKGGGKVRESKLNAMFGKADVKSVVIELTAMITLEAFYFAGIRAYTRLNLRVIYTRVKERLRDMTKANTRKFTAPTIPMFDGHYLRWAKLMKNFLLSKEYWPIVEHDDDTSKQIWDAMQQKYHGLSKVWQSQLQALKREFELLSMKEGEKVNSFMLRTLAVVNKMKINGEQEEASVMYMQGKEDEEQALKVITMGQVNTWREEVKFSSKGRGHGSYRGRGRERGRSFDKATIELKKNLFHNIDNASIKSIKNETQMRNFVVFHLEYYIPFHFTLGVPAATSSIADFPEGKVGESLPRDERPPPGSYSMEDAELINEKNQMDLFRVWFILVSPSWWTTGVRPLRDWWRALFWKVTQGAQWNLWLEQPEVESLIVIGHHTTASVPGATLETPQAPQADATRFGSLEDADVAGAESETGEVDSRLKRKRATSDDGAGTSKRARHQAALVAQLRARFSSERSQSVQKDEEILLLKTQVSPESGGAVEKQEEKLRKLNIEYDEELYPHMLSAIVERRRKGGGLHEKKLLTVPAAQVPGYNDNAYEELVAAMETMKLLELPHIAQLERDQDYPIDVIMAGLTLARHATEGAEAQPDYFLKPDVAQLQVPIFACSARLP